MSATLITLNGTATAGPDDPWQFPVRVANALLPQPMQGFVDKLDGVDRVGEWPWRWYAIDYPAATFPMKASVDVGVANTVASIGFTPGDFYLLGYSQGAVVTSIVWRDHILDPKGSLHHRLPDFKGALNWGNPLRAKGIARGNDYAGWPIPDGDSIDQFLSGSSGGEVTGGIAGPGKNLTAEQTPGTWLDFANTNDLYTDCPVGTPAGHDETLIYNIVMSTGGWDAFQQVINLMFDAATQLVNPVKELIGVAEAIYNGMRFAAAGPGAGHYTYNVEPAIQWLREQEGD